MRVIYAAIQALFLIAWCNLAVAQSIIGSGIYGDIKKAAAFHGVGDIVSSAQAYQGLRGYNAASSGNAVMLCTPSDATCSNVTIVSGGLNSTTLATLGCNNSTTICTAKEIYDQTNGTYCGGAPCNATQATIASRAVFVVNCIGSLPCLKTTSSTVYSCSSNSTFPSQPYSWSVVSQRYANFTSISEMVEGQSSGVLFFYTSSASQVSIQGGGSFTATASDSAFHAFQLVYNTGSSAIVVDGSSTPGTLTGSANGSAIGLWCGNATRGSTELLEAALWGVALTGAQQTNLNTNEHSYWGF